MVSFIYLTQVILYASCMWGIYFAVWRNRPLHHYSRMYLIISLILPVLIPFVRMPVPAMPVTTNYAIALSEINIGSVKHIQPANEFSWVSIFTLLYVTVSIALTITYMRSYIQINKKLQKGCGTKYNGYSIITDTTIGPGTLG